MRTLRPLSKLGAVLLLLSAPASAVTIDWTPVGNPDNGADTTGYGAVGYAYSIGTYEVTNAQYAEFLNAVAAVGQSDPYALYSTNMGSGFGGITRTVVGPDYSYVAISGRADMPVNHVSFYDALRFANWLNNGQGGGSTETGAYTLLGGTAIPSNGTAVTRNAGATIVLPSEDEWYKAAYYSPLTTSYYDYPGGFDIPMTCTAPTVVPNSANCDGAEGSDAIDADVDDLTVRGSFTGSASPYGTFDQAGNVREWNETIESGSYRKFRGGDFISGSSSDGASSSGPALFGEEELVIIGFRVAMIPEPGTGLLVITGLLGLAVRRRVSA